MHFHHITLQHLARYLTERYGGAPLVDCFSQNRNELVLGWEAGWLRIGCHSPLTYAVPVAQYSRARKNVVDLFPDLGGRALTGARVVPHERELVLEWAGDYQLILKLHGISANVLLRSAGRIQAMFNQQQEGDWNYVEVPGLTGSLPAGPDPAPDDLKGILAHIRQVSRTYDKQFARRVSEQMSAAGQSLAAALGAVLAEAESDTYYVVHEGTRLRFLLVGPPAGQDYVRLRGIGPALDFFLRSHFQFEYYQQRYRALTQERARPRDKFRKVYASYAENIDHLETERDPEELGHLLMAHLHAIPAGIAEVSLPDFYREGETRIRLDPRLSAADNAARYYRKHKERRSKLAHLRLQLAEVGDKLAAAEAAWAAVADLTPPAELDLSPAGLDPEAVQALRDLDRVQARQVGKPPPPFRHFRQGGFDIYVGRHARNSDELSFKFAAKDDLWLHAKDVAGAHVIVRRAGGRDIPPPVVEYAAQLAAYFSKRRQDSLVPVQYTARKYIRKRKGDPPGLVAVDREEVILVEPLRSL